MSSPWFSAQTVFATILAGGQHNKVDEVQAPDVQWGCPEVAELDWDRLREGAFFLTLLGLRYSTLKRRHLHSSISHLSSMDAAVCIDGVHMFIRQNVHDIMWGRTRCISTLAAHVKCMSRERVDTGRMVCHGCMAGAEGQHRLRSDSHILGWLCIRWHVNLSIPPVFKVPTGIS